MKLDETLVIDTSNPFPLLLSQTARKTRINISNLFLFIKMHKNLVTKLFPYSETARNPSDKHFIEIKQLI